MQALSIALYENVNEALKDCLVRLDFTYQNTAHTHRLKNLFVRVFIHLTSIPHIYIYAIVQCGFAAFIIE